MLVINHDKIYVATLKLGIKTDTGDITGDIFEKIDFDKKCLEEENVRNIRQRILRFQDEILMGKKHSKEHFDEVLSDVDAYEKYCNTHPDYKNNKAVLAIETIKEVYADCIEEHSFLTYAKESK